MAFSIVTDTPANLPLDRVCKNGLVTIPFSYYLNGEENMCFASEAFDAPAFFQAMKQHAELSTSMIPPQRFVEYWEPLLKSGLDILFVSLSSGISSSYSSAQIAAQQMEDAYPDRKIRLVDSLGASLGEGILVLRALTMREQGMSLDETADALLALRHRVCHVFTVDDLMYLSRGGRLSGASAMLGTVLNLKPILKASPEGTIVVSSKTRGRKHALKALAQRYEELAEYPGDQVVGIAHGNCPEDAEALADMLRKTKPPKEIIITCFEPVTGTYAGPGAIALFFEGGEDVRQQ